MLPLYEIRCQPANINLQKIFYLQGQIAELTRVVIYSIATERSMQKNSFISIL